jgi:thioredoxin-like negative regulator of GroEL
MLLENSDNNDTELGTNNTNNIIDVVTEDFMPNVIEKSKEIPVIV